MHINEREIKWAAGGFIGGFLVCWLLIGVFRPEPPTSPPLTGATPSAAWPPVPLAPAVEFTNLELPELRIETPRLRWVWPSPIQLVAPQSGYSLDLIDTHYQPPKLSEKP